MSSARNHAPRRSRLVLLRGGLDDQNSDVGGGDGGSDWQDFLRVGIPLTAAIALTTAWLARWLWLDGPLWPGIGG